jgi:hypothetical protein
MCSQAECTRLIGQPVRFRTPYGLHHGVIERVTRDKAIIVSPIRYVPPQFQICSLSEDAIGAETQSLDVELAWGGPVARGAYPGAGRGAAPMQGIAPYGYGYARWAVSFLIIFALFGLWAW